MTDSYSPQCDLMLIKTPRVGKLHILKNKVHLWMSQRAKNDQEQTL